ncbi:MAG: FecR domain-containing protein [Lewinellaceae bacterium]|nr:FecR domain-containing protein [Lewinellaceae bacterium]
MEFRIWDTLKKSAGQLPEQRKAGDTPELQLQRLWEISGRYPAGKSWEPDVEANLQAFRKRISQEKIIPRNKLNRRRWVSLSVAAAISVLVVFWAGQQGAFDAFLWQRMQAGETSQTLVLPDGSTVVLNANATIEYPRWFSQKPLREVRLRGEAFFEVAKDPARPFVVHAEPLEVKVLGTAFNVRTQAGNAGAQVNVKSGRVEVMHTGNGERTEITANEEVLLESTADNLQIHSRRADIALAWQTGKLTFKGESTGEVLRELERYCGLQVTTSQPALLNCPVTGNFTISASAEYQVKLLCEMNNWTAERDSTGKYLLKGKPCH